MERVSKYRFTRDHEWVYLHGTIADIGITQHAQEALGDIVFVELPEVEKVFKQNEIFGVVESVKTTSELFCPLSGEVVERNNDLGYTPQLVNTDCYGEGWMIRIFPSNPAELDSLMTYEQYHQFLSEQG